MRTGTALERYTRGHGLAENKGPPVTGDPARAEPVPILPAGELRPIRYGTAESATGPLETELGGGTTCPQGRRLGSFSLSDRMATMFRFEIHHSEPTGGARRGILSLPHGSVRTPAFMPIGTRAAVKGILPQQVRESGAEIILGNTYHLVQRPGTQIIAEFGGLHRFMGWDGPILTDSGGYQVFSLADLNKVTDDGVTFRSHFDGQYLHIDPESAIAIQNSLGADIIMAFDQCPPGDADPALASAAVERTVRWADRCRRAHRRTDQALFGIVQGGIYPELRQDCVSVASRRAVAATRSARSTRVTVLEMR